MGPLLSAFCDGEAGAEEAATLREHLRACASCRATLRAYRAAPGAVAALAPALPIARSLLDRVHEAGAALAARFAGGDAGTDSALAQVTATGGARGAGIVALAKVAAICFGAAGGVACVATGVVTPPLGVGHDRSEAPAVERRVDPKVIASWKDETGVDYESAPQPTVAPAPEPAKPDPKPSAVAVAPSSAATGDAVEYQAPAPQPVAAAAGSAGSSGSPAGEFGP
jgi:hypothetical protein